MIGESLIAHRFEGYATRRYGMWNEYAVAAWKRLGKTVYNFVGTQKIRGHYVITDRPSLNITPWVEKYTYTYIHKLIIARTECKLEFYRLRAVLIN